MNETSDFGPNDRPASPESEFVSSRTDVTESIGSRITVGYILQDHVADATSLLTPLMWNPHPALNPNPSHSRQMTAHSFERSTA